MNEDYYKKTSSEIQGEHVKDLIKKTIGAELSWDKVFNVYNSATREYEILNKRFINQTEKETIEMYEFAFSKAKKFIYSKHKK